MQVAKGWERRALGSEMLLHMGFLSEVMGCSQTDGSASPRR